MRQLAFSTFAFDGKSSPIYGNILYNLPLILAFDVLQQVLLLAKDEGLFTASRHQLADLMDGAKTVLQWIDSQCLRDGVDCRNEVVHHGKLHGDLQCLHYIADIEAQLLAWGIITPTLTLADQPVNS